ncbi:hypothetical protein CI109_101819 [Kwoniella shandongensis]|uniref:Uncharacterized protein n=1 Tax=Kwoniella shandongensis TaxID=1734106 RepID=A0A5M6CAZ3_9TREE|nr:uncharacterized protein CI109_001059 [Kwoniella shandongensis]KAA5530259.1 hypothetical protein CI109_001059 [Kwoniella shandongensis]
MSAFNETDVHPTGVQGEYAGVQNVSASSGNKSEDVFATGGTLAGHTGVPTESGYEHTVSAKPQDVIEGKPGVIESTELAPLGDEKVAADPGLVSQATSLAKGAYNAVVGEK